MAEERKSDTLESRLKKPHDPWDLLGKEVKSTHCKGKKAKIISYDCTGATDVECACGEIYTHDQGVYGKGRPICQFNRL